MDLIKIGRYIAGKRKEQGMTQRQLAEQLNMSDKSVSKWERGVCLPDVSVYSDLCRILGISINEFLAGEDIDRDSIAQKADENILEVTADGQLKQKRSKIVIYVLLLISLAAVSAMIAGWCLANKPKNYVKPLDRDSIEGKTAELLSGVDGAFLYRFAATDTYQTLTVYYSEYQAGQLVKRENLAIGNIWHDAVASSKSGMIVVVPDFERFVVKLSIADEGAKLSTEIPILDSVPEREYYMRSATEILGAADIRYGEEQPLLALIYDNDQMYVCDIEDIAEGRLEYIAEDDYVYYFSYEFSKEQS